MEQGFTISFIELLILTQESIPPKAIARTEFWKKMINTYYGKMDPEQRKVAFEWITREAKFNKEEELCQWFYARYNPKNQFIVTTMDNRIGTQHRVFRKDEDYWINMDTKIDFDMITHIRRI